MRELQNAIEHAVALCDGTTIRLDDLPEAVIQATRTEALRDAVRAGKLGLEEATARFEKDLLLEALERCDWNQTRAAEMLGVTRRLVKLKMDRHQIREPE